jgi:hypothetical protein
MLMCSVPLWKYQDVEKLAGKHIIQFKIGPFTYDCVPVDGFTSSATIAEHNPISLEIRIDKSLAGQKAVYALMHEIVEAWNEMYELELEHNKICVLSTAITQFMMENSLEEFVDEYNAKCGGCGNSEDSSTAKEVTRTESESST